MCIRDSRELGASIDTGVIGHEAYYEPKWRRVEIFARFLEAQEIKLEPLGSSFRVAAGGLILTEISRKFHLNRIVPYLDTFGFETMDIFSDSLDRFAVLLLKRE